MKEALHPTQRWLDKRDEFNFTNLRAYLLLTHPMGLHLKSNRILRCKCCMDHKHGRRGGPYFGTQTCLLTTKSLCGELYQMVSSRLIKHLSKKKEKREMDFAPTTTSVLSQYLTFDLPSCITLLDQVCAISFILHDLP